MADQRRIVVRLPLMAGEVEQDGDCTVKFPVTPPTMTTPEGNRVLLIDDEGAIDVLCQDGGIVVRGRFAISIEPQGANTVFIQLVDAVTERGQRGAPAVSGRPTRG